MGETIAITWTDVVIAVAAALTFVVLLAAAICAWFELRHRERDREAQLLADLSRRWDEESLTEPRQLVEEYKERNKLKQAMVNFRDKNDKEAYVLLRLPDFFEELGLLVRNKCLSLQLAKDMFGTAIKYHYNRYEPIIKLLRKKYKDETIYEFFEGLAQKC